jgi:hypothetical protein
MSGMSIAIDMPQVGISTLRIKSVKNTEYSIDDKTGYSIAHSRDAFLGSL